MADQASPTDLEQEIMNRAKQAEFILKHPIVAGAIEAMKNNFSRKWVNSEPGDVETRELAYRHLHAVHTFERLLTRFAEDGKLVEAEIETRRYQGQKATEGDEDL